MAPPGGPNWPDKGPNRALTHGQNNPEKPHTKDNNRITKISDEVILIPSIPTDDDGSFYSGTAECAERLNKQVEVRKNKHKQV